MINWEAIGAVGEVVGAAAVVISLIYLAIQIRQTGRVARFTAHQTLSDSLSSIVEPLHADPEMNEIWELAERAPEEMTPTQQERFGLFLYAVFGIFVNAHLLSEIDEGLSRGFVRLMDRFLVRRGVQGWWQRQGKHFAPDFRRVVDDRLAAVTAARATGDD